MEAFQTQEMGGATQILAEDLKRNLLSGPGYSANLDQQSGLAANGTVDSKQILPKQTLPAEQERTGTLPPEHGAWPHNKEVSHRPVKGLGDLAAALNADTPQASHLTRADTSGHFAHPSNKDQDSTGAVAEALLERAARVSP
jgi:hypothetical protein